MTQHLPKLIDYSCYLSQEIIILIVDYFSYYYVAKVKVNDFNVLIGGKSFFDLSVKNEEAYEKIIDMSNNSVYTTGNLLDYAYYKKHYID